MTSAARRLALPVTGVPDPQDIHAGVWHAHTLATPTQAVQATGDTLLDAHLPGGGWPVGALVELLQAPGAHCEWRLLLPALVACGRGPVVLVGAPHVPFAPALSGLGLRAGRLFSVLSGAQGAEVAAEGAGRLWATEQLLRCAEVDAVLAWLPQARGEQLRRLHLAAAEHQKLLFVMRPDRARSDASPAVLRLRVQPTQGRWTDGLAVDILKRRGPPLAEPLQLQALSHRLGVLLAAGATTPPAQPLPVDGRVGRGRRARVPQHLEAGHALDRAAALA